MPNIFIKRTLGLIGLRPDDVMVNENSLFTVEIWQSRKILSGEAK